LHVQRDPEVSARVTDLKLMRVTTAATILNLEEQKEDAETEIGQAY
jgi:hypothetical protein